LAFDFDYDPPPEVEDHPCDVSLHPQTEPPAYVNCDAFFEYLGSEFSDPIGHGAAEAMITFGDSGGPQFVTDNGIRKIAGVTSHFLTLSLKTDLKIGGGFQDQHANFGEIGVAMRVSYGEHLTWLDDVLDIPPRVDAVTIGSSENSHEDYRMPSGYNPDGQPGCTGTGCDVTALQFRTVPVAQPNWISVQFSKDVIVEQSSLEVYGMTTDTDYHEQEGNSFSYDDESLTATWFFDQPLAVGGVDQIELILSGVTDLDNRLLDAEWNDPEGYDDPDGSVFPSGDFSEGGTNTFVFQFNLIAADFNRDNLVEGSDYGIWNANKFTNVSNGFMLGDANGDDFVDGSDFGVWNTWKFTEWRGSGQSMMSGGPYGPSGTWSAQYDDLLAQFNIYANGQINSSLSVSEWEEFADLLVELLNEL
jgi:hypothetical protein